MTHEKRTTRADREAVADLLAEHYAAGTLDDDEYHDRLDTAMSAKFPSALAALSVDLPDLPKPEQPAAQPAPYPRAGAFRAECASYRGWTPGQWKGQNIGAVVVSILAVALVGATQGHLFGVSLAVCGVANLMLGSRKNKALGWVGLLSGLFLTLGTVLMIGLTWRSNPDSRALGSSCFGLFESKPVAAVRFSDYLAQRPFLWGEVMLVWIRTYGRAHA